MIPHANNISNESHKLITPLLGLFDIECTIRLIFCTFCNGRHESVLTCVGHTYQQILSNEDEMDDIDAGDDEKSSDDDDSDSIKTLVSQIRMFSL